MLDQKIKPNIVVFLMNLGLTLSILVCYLIAKKHSIASEFVSPLLTLCFGLLCIPTYYEDPKHATLLSGATLVQLYFAGHLFYLTLTMFFTASYLPALATRIVYLGIFLHLAIRRNIEGSATALVVSFNIIMTTLVVELNAYNTNRKTL